MPLTPIQQVKLNEIQSCLSIVAQAYNAAQNLANKVQTASVDTELALSVQQISALVARWTFLRQNLIDAANALPVI